MALWNFEPGHTSAEFAVRHMLITMVRGCFKNIAGTLQFDPADPERSSVEVSIDAASFSTAEEERDEHLRSADFLDVANCPT
ncbi:YceI family protein, partial [Acidobacteriia bacterium AH_259_A11_L15]|nr:YceI family protein [Acidobacteriia bacterium AH_259_A11_L15]